MKTDLIKELEKLNEKNIKISSNNPLLKTSVNNKILLNGKKIKAHIDMNNLVEKILTGQEIKLPFLNNKKYYYKYQELYREQKRNLKDMGKQVIYLNLINYFDQTDNKIFAPYFIVPLKIIKDNNSYIIHGKKNQNEGIDIKVNIYLIYHLLIENSKSDFTVKEDYLKVNITKDDDIRTIYTKIEEKSKVISEKFNLKQLLIKENLITSYREIDEEISFSKYGEKYFNNQSTGFLQYNSIEKYNYEQDIYFDLKHMIKKLKEKPSEIINSIFKEENKDIITTNTNTNNKHISNLFYYISGIENFNKKNLTFNLSLKQKDILNKSEENLIIQGPPGTGKSTTIVNLLVNLVNNNNTILFITEKKTAIDVVYDNMNGLHHLILKLTEISSKKDAKKMLKKQIDSYFEKLPKKKLCISKTLEKTDEFYDMKYFKNENILNDISSIINYIEKENLNKDEIELLMNFCENKNIIPLYEDIIQPYCKHIKDIYIEYKTNPELLVYLSKNQKNTLYNLLKVYRNEKKFYKLFNYLFRKKTKEMEVIIKQYNFDMIQNIKFENLEHINTKTKLKYIKKLEIRNNYNLNLHLNIKRIKFLKEILDLNNNNIKNKLEMYKIYLTLKTDLSIEKIEEEISNKPLIYFINRINNIDLKVKEKLKNKWDKNIIFNYLSNEIELYELEQEFEDINYLDNIDFNKPNLEKSISYMCNYFDDENNNTHNPFNNIINILKEEHPLKKIQLEELMKFSDTKLYWNIILNDYEILRNLILLSINKNEYFNLIKNFNFYLENSNQLSYNNSLIAYESLFNKFREKENLKNIDIMKNIKNVKTFPKRELHEVFDQYKIILKEIPIFMLTIDAAVKVLPKEVEIFDYVIYDEASQLKLEKAISTLIRAKNYIIVGDEQQLPPIERFRKNIEGVESSIDKNIDEEAKSLLEKVPCNNKEMLNTVYRAKHSQLMEISNKFFYNNELEIIDDCSYSNTPYEFHFVKADKNDKEVLKQNDKIIEILQNKQCSSEVGICVFNKAMYDDLQNKLDEANLNYKWLYNIDNIQGIEAKEVIIATTYPGETARFGEINNAHFKNALNVIFSRAKEKMIIVTSFDSKNENLRNSKNENLKILKEFLYLAENFTQNSKNQKKSHDHLTNYIKSRTKHLTNNRIELHYDLGENEYKLLIGVFEKNSKKYVLGINLILPPKDKNDASKKLEEEIDKINYFKSRNWNIKNISLIDILYNPNVIENIIKSYDASLINEKLSQKKLIINSDSLKTNFNSNFEEEVFNELKKILDPKYKLLVNYQRNKNFYEYDLVISFNKEVLLIIEVDGNKYHLNETQQRLDSEKDLNTERIYGIDIFRINDELWKNQKIETIKKIKSKLELEITKRSIYVNNQKTY